jgi:hypothetical protein
MKAVRVEVNGVALCIKDDGFYIQVPGNTYTHVQFASQPYAGACTAEDFSKVLIGLVSLMIETEE